MLADQTGQGILELVQIAFLDEQMGTFAGELGRNHVQGEEDALGPRLL